MQTTVTTKITIPAELSRKMGITPGCQLHWQQAEEGGDGIRVRVIPTRGERARRLMGVARQRPPERDSVAELVAERMREEDEQILS